MTICTYCEQEITNSQRIDFIGGKTAHTECEQKFNEEMMKSFLKENQMEPFSINLSVRDAQNISSFANFLGHRGVAGYFNNTLGSESLPISSELINNIDLVSFLTTRGVVNITKVVPWLDPCTDTLSISRAGDTIAFPHFWNLLLIEYD